MLRFTRYMSAKAEVTAILDERKKCFRVENKDLQISMVRLLHMSRSAPSLLTTPGVVEKDASETVCFSLFDYFDWLVVHKGDVLDYRACFGLEQAVSAPPLVSSAYLTLVSLAGEEAPRGGTNGIREGDPFFGGEGEDLSTLPFLSLILVTVLPDPIVSPAPKPHSFPICPKDVDGFLRTCTASLRQWVREECGDAFQAGETLQAVFQVYNCINSGNFCVAIRSRTPELAYHVSMRVRAETLRQAEGSVFPHLDCSTYSLGGLVCPKDVVPQTFPHDALRDSTAEMALRLSVTNQVRNSLFFHAADYMSEDLRGLYGRYDVTLRLNLRQFGQLYPWIISKKLGHPFPQDSGKDEVDEIVHLLRQGLLDQGAQCLNARLLLHMEGTTALDNVGARRKKRQDTVMAENGAVSQLLEEVTRRGDLLVYCQEEYHASLLLLRDLWESYRGLRYQDDSFIDGNILLVQVRLLLNTVKLYLESMDKECTRQPDYETLSRSLRLAINSIDHFQKLMMSINQQSMQAPNYEMQMHCDMEKFVVAYTEFSRRFLSEHFPSAGSGSDVPLEKRRQLFFPIISVNTTLEAIQAHPLFLLPYRQKKDGLFYSNLSDETLLLSIEVPENGLLGDVYAFLPLLCHELSHNFRVLDRNERNDALVQYLFLRIAQFIVRRWISQTSENNIYHAFGYLEDELYIDELAALLKEAYLERCGEAHNTANIGALVNNIRVFLTEDIFTRKETNQLQRPDLTLDQVRDQLSWLCRLALDASGEEKPDWGGEYQACQDAFTAARDAEGKDWEYLSKGLRSLAKRLTQVVAVGYARQVEEVGKIFCERLEEDMRAWIDPLLKEICNTEKLQRVILSSESEVDQWIANINKWCQQMDLLSGRWRQVKNLAREARMLDHSICSMCRAVKDANHLYMILGSCHTYENKPYKSKVRDNLIQEYHKRIRAKLDQYYADREYPWLLHSAPSIHELTAPLGVDLDDETFTKMLKRIFLSTARHDYFMIIDMNMTLYREISADLGMCVSLGLSTFGYLNVLAHNSPFQVLDSPFSNVKLERIRIVCLALIEGGGLAKDDVVDALCRNGQACTWELARRLEREMNEASLDARSWKEIRQWIEDVLEGKKKIRPVPAFRLPLEVFAKWFDPGMSMDLVHDLYGQLKALWSLAHFINYLRNVVDSGMKHPLQQHFSELLPIIRSQWQKDETNAPSSRILQKVGEAYNGPSGIRIFLDNRERFLDTLSFVLYYYYHGWNVYGWSDRSDVDIWLGSLMRGVSQ